MIKTLFIVLALFVLSFTSFSQAKITIGSPYEVIDAENKNYFLNAGEILAVKVIDDARVVIQKMNAATLKFKSVKIYDDFPKNIQVERITKFKNKIYVFYSNIESKKEQLFAREIDVAKGVFKGAEKKIITVEDFLDKALEAESLIRKEPREKYDFNFSFDSTVLAIQYRLRPKPRDRGKNPALIGMYLFDSDLKKQWGDQVTMPYTEENMIVTEYGVDSKSNVYIAAFVSYPEKGTSEFQVIKISSDGQIKPVKVDVDKKHLMAMRLFENAEGTMICAGYYTNDGMGIDGLAMFKIGQDGGVTDFNAYEIPLAILNQNVSAKTKRKNNKDEDPELRNLKLKHVEMMRDGSIVLVGEQSDFDESTERQSTTTGNNGQYNRRTSSTTTRVFHSDDILITKIDALGKLAWMSRLPKRQESYSNFSGMGHTYVRGSKSHYMIFLDNEKNKDLGVTDVPERHISGLGGFVTAYAVDDATGKASKLFILNTRNVNDTEVGQFSPTRLLGTALNTVVFEAYKKKGEDVLVKIELPN